MTKKNFIALADELRGADIPDEILLRLCSFMKKQNPQFKSGRWVDYLAGKCGPNGGALH